VSWAVGPKTLYAIDLGVGGRIEPEDGFSIITLGMPARMDGIAGQGQTGPAGSPLPIKPKVRLSAVHGAIDPRSHAAALTGRIVRCEIVGAGGGLVVGATVVASALATEPVVPDGSYECPAWQLPMAPGTFSLKVTSASLDPIVYLSGPGGITTLPGTVTFNAQTSHPITVNAARGRTASP
jgi:hypothetical protein